MKHYVVVHDWANEYECGTTILGVEHSMEKAKKIFNNCLADEKQYAIENGLYVYDDYETVFDAGEEGNYIRNHTNLYIQLV